MSPKYDMFQLGVVTVEVITRDGHTYLEDWNPIDAEQARVYAEETSFCDDVLQVVYSDHRNSGVSPIVFGGKR